MSSAILSTVTARRPALFAQKEEDRAKAVDVYRRMGFKEMPRKGGVFCCLQPLVERPGKRPGSAGPGLAALAGLVGAGAFGHSLPMGKADMCAKAARRIVWWELAGRSDGEAWWKALAAEPPAPLAGLTLPDWLRLGAAVEARWKRGGGVAVVAEIRAAGTRGLRVRVCYIGDDGAATDQVWPCQRVWARAWLDRWRQDVVSHALGCRVVQRGVKGWPDRGVAPTSLLGPDRFDDYVDDADSRRAWSHAERSLA